MKWRGRRRGSRTWLAIHASTKASTSGDLRILAHSDAERKPARRRTIMGEFLIAAIRARNLPVDAIRQPIDALPPLLLGPSDWIGTDQPVKGTPAGTGRFLPTTIIVAAGCLPVRIILAGKHVRVTAGMGRSCGASKSAEIPTVNRGERRGGELALFGLVASALRKAHLIDNARASGRRRRSPLYIGRCNPASWLQATEVE
jgi:hypothetical protein